MKYFTDGIDVGLALKINEDKSLRLGFPGPWYILEFLASITLNRFLLSTPLFWKFVMKNNRNMMKFFILKKKYSSRSTSWCVLFWTEPSHVMVSWLSIASSIVLLPTNQEWIYGREIIWCHILFLHRTFHTNWCCHSFFYCRMKYLVHHERSL